MSFRMRLARAIGIDLEKMHGFRGTVAWDTFDDPIKPLLDHSDCDGELTPGECSLVASRLRELVSDWSDEDYDKRHAIYLAEGMEDAAACGENLEFR